MVSVDGTAPPTRGSSGRRSTFELHRHGASDGDRTRLNLLDRQVVSPETYRRMLVDRSGTAPLSPECKTGVFPSVTNGPCLVHASGIEPARVGV